VIPNPGTTYEPAVGQVRALVNTTQIAPTILTLLSLDPTKLTAVQVEGVKALPAVSSKNGDEQRKRKRSWRRCN
jgi:hypothetical protein